MTRADSRYEGFPEGFFTRVDDTDDRRFYTAERLVTHIDEPAITAVGLVYEALGLEGRVLDLMSSWISHFRRPPRSLIALGMNGSELAANEMADGAVVADLNRRPQLPFDTDSFDGAVCCVSVDYLTKPIEVFDEVARVVRTGGTFCCTFSNRCFPTKAIAGWLHSDDRGHIDLVARYFALSGRWSETQATAAVPQGGGSDPLYAVWAAVAGPSGHAGRRSA
jgi:SAM-dependent methyltransferase